jgi:outer membrane protein
MVRIIIFISLFLTPFFTLHAEQVKLLEIPLSGTETYDYSVDLKEKCSFKDVSEIKVSPFDTHKREGFIKDELTTAQKEANLSIKDKVIQHDRITFTLEGSQSTLFEFFFDKKTCQLQKIINIDHEKYNYDSVDIEYSRALGSAVPEKLIIKKKDNRLIALYSSQLDGEISAYEFNVGAGVEVRTNIRLNNQDDFERNHPVIKPTPAFLIRYGPLFLTRDGVGSLVFHTGDLSVLLTGIIEGEPYQGPGLEERSHGVFIGSTVKFHFMEFVYYNDFFNDKGYNLKLNLAPQFHSLSSWIFSPQAFVQYWDDKYVDYYFGVRPFEVVSSGLTQYKGSHTLNYGTMFETRYLMKRWTFVSDLGMKFYGKEIYSSPTVVRKNEVRWAFNALYKFF